MSTPTAPALEHHIAQLEAQLAQLKKDQALLQNLKSRKEELQKELQRINGQIGRITGKAPTVAAPAAAKPTPTPPKATAKPATPTSTPAKAVVKPAESPRLADLILESLKGAKGKPLTVKQLTEETLKRGFTTSSSSPYKMVESRVQDLSKKGVIVRAKDQPGWLLKASANGKAKT